MRRRASGFIAAVWLGAATFAPGCQDNSTGCCVVCNGSCPCGNSCLSCSTRCTQPKGCACGPSEPLTPGEQASPGLLDGGASASGR